MKKHIANLLTITRMVLSLFLLIFYDDVNLTFLIVFTIGVFTDMIDGTIARKTNSSSFIGSVLDTVADVLLSLNIMKVAIISGELQGMLLIWLMLILAIGLISPVIAYIKFRKIYFVHSVLSKIVGGLIYFVPFTLYFNFFKSYLVFVLVMFSITVLQILVINILSEEADSDIKSLLSIIKSYRKTEEKYLDK